MLNIYVKDIICSKNYRRTRTHIDCSSWTTKAVGKYAYS